jgi:hypothetical protein
MGRGMKLGKIEKVLPKNANGNVKGKTRNEERKSCGGIITGMKLGIQERYLLTINGGK